MAKQVMRGHSEGEPKFDFIDAARGYAILLVIICHTVLPQEPWPVRRFANLGWHGVQLFFVVSSMTLALSWRYRRDAETNPVLSFLARRLFRIWPMYFVAFVAYFVIWPPGARFSVVHVLTSLTFTHGWSPGLLPTDAGWDVVPGSWSVAAEFSFYLLFPLLVWIAATPVRAVLLTVLALGIAAVCDPIGYRAYVAEYGASATDQWVYYWFPNQFPIFTLGFVACHCFLRLQPGQAWAAIRTRLVPWCPALALLAAAIFLSLGLWPNAPRAPSLWPPTLPIHLVASMAFAVAVLAIGLSPSRLFVNPFTVWLGKVSFSAYLIHFAVINQAKTLLPNLFGASVVGVQAIIGSALLLGITLGITGPLATLTYRTIEQPMIARGRRVCIWLNRRALSRQTQQPAPIFPTSPL